MASRSRKAIWLSNDKYNVLNKAKRRYEQVNGATDWGAFLLFVLGIALESKAFNQIFHYDEVKLSKNSPENCNWQGTNSSEMG